MLDGGPGDGQPSKVAVPRADLIEDSPGCGRRLIQDRRCLDHLDHEGRPPPGEISAAPTRLNRRSTMPICALRRARSCPSGPEQPWTAFLLRKVDLPAMFGPVTEGSGRTRKPSGGGDRSGWPQSLALTANGLLNDGVPPRRDGEGAREHRSATCPPAAAGELRQAEGDIEPRDRIRKRPAQRTAPQERAPQLLEHASSMATARSPALAIFASALPAPRSENRIAPCIGLPVDEPPQLSGGCRKRSPSFCGTSTK